MQATDGGIQHSTNHQNDAGDHQSLEQSNVICVCFLTRLLQVFFVPLDPHELTLTVKPNEPLFAALCHSTQDTSEDYTHHICKSDHRHERSHKCRWVNAQLFGIHLGHGDCAESKATGHHGAGVEQCPFKKIRRPARMRPHR